VRVEIVGISRPCRHRKTREVITPKINLICSPGTGKTIYIKSKLESLDRSTFQNIQTAFSAQTSANQVQDIIDNKLDKRRKVGQL
jgi:hypothetical protein